MAKCRKLFFLASFFLWMLLASTVVFAQTTTVNPAAGTTTQVTIDGTANCTEDGSGYCLLEPLPIGTSGTVFDRISSQSTLSGYLNTFFKIGIGIIGVLAVIMLIVGGVQYMTTDAFSGKESGKESITNAIGGLILALASYLILVTINPQLVSLQFGVHKVEVEGTSFQLPSQTEITGNYNASDDGAVTPSAAAAEFGTGTIDDSQWRNVLVAPPFKVTIKGSASDNCKKVGEQGCTSVFKLKFDHVQKIRDACPNCEIVITGGTEFWLHKSHLPNMSIIDLRKTPSLKTFIHSSSGLKSKCLVGWPAMNSAVDEPNKPCPFVDKNGQTIPGKRSSIAYWLPSIGLGFVDEGDHYHTTDKAIQ